MDTVLSEQSNQVLTALVQGISYLGSSASTCNQSLPFVFPLPLRSITPLSFYAPILRSLQNAVLLSIHCMKPHALVTKMFVKLHSKACSKSQNITTISCMNILVTYKNSVKTPYSLILKCDWIFVHCCRGRSHYSLRSQVDT